MSEERRLHYHTLQRHECRVLEYPTQSAYYDITPYDSNNILVILLVLA